jgi:hypothetical protein
MADMTLSWHPAGCDTTHLAIVRPERRSFASTTSGERFPHYPARFSAWTKAGLELEISLHLAAPFFPSRQRSKSVGTIGFVTTGDAK